MENLPFTIIPTNISEKKLLELFTYYRETIPYQEDSYVFGGKKVIPLRKSCMLGKDYVYSGILKKAIPLDHITQVLGSAFAKKLDLPADFFNACLVNIYENGNASISYHKDDEKEMDPNAPILALSLGATRKFYFRHVDRDRKDRLKKYEIKNGDLLIMYPDAQIYWEHSIPKEKDVDQARISLTFRRFL